MDILSLDSLSSDDLNSKRVLMRVDFNVPLKQGQIIDDTRIKAALPSITYILERGSSLILMSHLGRPKGLGFEADFSMKTVAEHLATLLDAYRVRYINDISGDQARNAASALKPGEVLVLENLRFDAREKKGDDSFARELSELGDIYVNDAFGTAHRDHASVSKVAKYLPAYAGLLMKKELSNLYNLLESPKKPFYAVLGGSKVSDKVGIIEALSKRADKIFIGGAMCFTFLKAQGVSVGNSLVEDEWLLRIDQILNTVRENGSEIILPVDFICAQEFSEEADSYTSQGLDIKEGFMGLDIGPKTVELFSQKLKDAALVFWNGPMGVFEMPKFASGTKGVAQALANLDTAYTVIGGGDSVSAVHTFNLADKFNFISTGGGASMELLEGKVLPGVSCLIKR